MKTFLTLAALAALSAPAAGLCQAPTPLKKQAEAAQVRSLVGQERARGAESHNINAEYVADSKKRAQEIATLRASGGNPAEIKRLQIEQRAAAERRGQEQHALHAANARDGAVIHRLNQDVHGH